MNKSPLISIIMPAYNAQKYIKEAIDSVLNQTFNDFEFIIIDDESSDDTFKILFTYNDSRIKIINNKHDFIDSLNKGLSLAQGQYFVRMDADDIMLPHRLEVQYNYMENNPEVDICGSWMEVFQMNSYIYKNPANHLDICSGFLLKNCLSHPTIILRKDSISKLSYFPLLYRNDYIYAEDYKLWVDLAMNGLKFANIPEVLIKYRQSPDQITQRFTMDMKQKVDTIQLEYVQYISERIVEEYPELFDFIEKTILLFDTGQLTFLSLRHIIHDIYRYHLRRNLQKNKTKILFCIDSLGGGGAEKLLIDILKHFDYDKYYIDLLVLMDEGVYFTDIPNQVNQITLKDEVNLIESYDIEVAFLEGISLKYIAGRKTQAKKIVWVHADLFNFHWTKQYYENDRQEEISFSQMNKIIFVSKAGKKQFNKLFPKVEVTQEIICNFIDVEEIKRKSDSFIPKKEKLTLCSVGRLFNQKGYDRLIHVINRLVKEDNLDFEVWLVGNGEQRKEIEVLICKYSLENVVFLKGFQRNPYPYIKYADIFISSSYSEGYPLVVCEAIGLAKPIVATNVPGTLEILDNGKAGLIVEQTEDSIYWGLKKMILDEDLRNEYIQKAKNRSDIFDVRQSMNSIYKALTVEL